jgi:REP element-mobilizing transposase RayT
VPRNRRIALVDHPHVVIARGNNGDPVFFDERDYQAYLELVRELVREQLCVLYAWCLTKNAVRLVVAPRRIGLAQAVQRLHGSHARRINQRRGRTGHLFEGPLPLAHHPRALKPGPRPCAGSTSGPCATAACAAPRPGPGRATAPTPRAATRGAIWWTPGRVLERYGATLPTAQRAFARFVEAGALEQ